MKKNLSRRRANNHLLALSFALLISGVSCKSQSSGVSDNLPGVPSQAQAKSMVQSQIQQSLALQSAIANLRKSLRPVDHLFNALSASTDGKALLENRNVAPVFRSFKSLDSILASLNGSTWENIQSSGSWSSTQDVNLPSSLLIGGCANAKIQIQGTNLSSGSDVSQQVQINLIECGNGAVDPLVQLSLDNGNASAKILSQGLPGISLNANVSDGPCQIQMQIGSSVVQCDAIVFQAGPNTLVTLSPLQMSTDVSGDVSMEAAIRVVDSDGDELASASYAENPSLSHPEIRYHLIAPSPSPAPSASPSL